MQIVKFDLGCVLLSPRIIYDLRGEFMVTFSIEDLRKRKR